MKRLLILLTLFLIGCVPIESRQPIATPVPSLYRTFTTFSAPGLVMETSSSNESVKLDSTSGAWLCTAGGTSAGTHFARLRVKLPELYGVALTTFYMKVTVILPPDFYTKQASYFRILNTDNYGTTVNGTHYGASNSSELRTGVYFYSDHTMRIRAEHENSGKVEYYRGQLPVGRHVLELYGDVANVSPWWFKVDGIILASGVARLSPDSVPANERVITRLVAGIDGATDQDTNPMSLYIQDIVIADYNPSGSIPSTSTPITITPTRTIIPPTATRTPVPPTSTPTPIPLPTSFLTVNGTKIPCPCSIQVP